MAKEPRPGRVKTRLCPPCTPLEAAAIAEASLRDTLDVATASAGTVVLALDGRPGGWLPDRVSVIPQRGDGLAARLASAVVDVGGPVLVIGMDTPQLSADDLDQAIEALRAPGCDAVLGPAADGGYWAIGLDRPSGREFDGVPMSEPTTAHDQLGVLERLGLTTRTLPPFRDVDRFSDATAVAAEIPTSAFAAAVRQVESRRCASDPRATP